MKKRKAAWIDSEGLIHHPTDEPNFVKLYYEHLSFVVGLAKNDHLILYKLLSFMGYDHSIFVDVGMKRAIAVDLNLKTYKVVEQAIKRIVDANIFAKKGLRHYVVNPHLLAKGDWQSIKKMQNDGIKGIKFNLEYQSNGVKFTVDVE
ncbi:MAG: hypothetical protein GY810_14770 [Aureispira sp.]|nr:hypothetical protein [Aureispira sp.]